MIRATRSGVDAAAVAAMADPPLAPDALGRVLARLEPFSSPHAPRPLYDAEQAAAAVRGGAVAQLPDLPDHPDDLLDAGDAVALFAVPPSAPSWSQYVRRDPELRAAKVLVCGVVHHRRADVEAWRDARPRRGRGRGRPSGARDTAPRRSALRDGRTLAEQQTASGRRLTGALLASQLGIGERTAQRVLREVRGPARAPARTAAERDEASGRDARYRDRLEAAAQAIRANPELNGVALAEAIAVPQRTAYRLLHQLRGLTSPRTSA